MRDSDIFKKNANIVCRKIAGETILIPITRSSSDADYIYTLNKSAGSVWELIDGKKSVGDIKKELLKNFDVTAEEIRKKLQYLIGDLIKIKALIHKKK